jgi:superfamily II DNA or RNA helicase/diadenosine tetraphosphate (Ap4A) HIT family hydrolase/HKD family nuclease
MPLVCPFCDLGDRPLLHRGPLTAAFADGYPVTAGHTLVIPLRHAVTYFDLSDAEQAALWQAVGEVKALLDATLVPTPDGYNIGFNVHEAAGQTIAHAHVHVIPRYRGDMPNPRGGVRWVIPEKADYKLDWEGATPQDLADVADGPHRPLAPWLLADLSRATQVDIAVAFVWPTGLELVFPRLEECLERGGSVRFLTGDYEYLTAPDALRMLLDLTEFDRMQLRILETSRIGGSFHPKAYLLSNEGRGAAPVAYVGSSNLSGQALTTGHEWNMRLQGLAGVRRAQLAFDRLFMSEGTTEVTHAWVDAYERRREKHKARPTHSDVFIFDEPARKPFEPHAIQREALDALAATRADGNRAGLVVLATGLGKTWLAAFDSKPFPRVLFVAHRDEILHQAMHTFRSIRPKDRLGLYTGTEKHRGANVLFASVQTLARKEHRELFDPRYFDYIIIDEFHHASAQTYRSLLRHFDPTFLLGLTATPDRSDGSDLLDLCDDNLVYRCDLGRGIAEGQLCPFHYHGVPDLVDYEQIPWRSSRFDEEKLSKAVETRERAQNALEQWRVHAGPGSRTIGFCVSQRHADFMREFFCDAGLRAAAVHSNAQTTDPREESLEQLERGDLDVLFAVDMFNEGLDIKNVDTVLMLRPTESRILWLQQLGRGLRLCAGKTRLQVIDYIGNHRIFLQKPAALLGALGIDFTHPSEIPQALRNHTYEDALPPGCAVTYELEAIELLEKLFPATKSADALDALVEWYRAYTNTNGVRPTALQTLRAGRNPRTTQRAHDSWLAFVESEDGLDDATSRARARNATFLRELETAAMTRGYKMFLIEALLQLGTLPGQTPLDDLTQSFIRVCARSSLRRGDVSVDLDDAAQVKRLLVKYPIDVWCGRRDSEGRAYFELADDVLRTGPGIRSSVDTAESAAFTALITEIVEWRIAQYFTERRDGVRLNVHRDKSGNPILKLDRKRYDLPVGDTWVDVEIEGQPFRANFEQKFINVVAPQGEEPKRNVLPDLLYKWFGEQAGARGTQFAVAQDAAPDGGYRYRWSPDRAVINNGPEGVPLKRDDGSLVEARMLVEELDGAATVVVMSRGDGRNNQYTEGVELLLARLAKLGGRIERIAVESGATTTMDLQGRTVIMGGLDYPIDPASTSPRKLRLAIGKAVAGIGRGPGATGSGQPNKRIRIWVVGVDTATLERALVVSSDR